VLAPGASTLGFGRRLGRTIQGYRWLPVAVAIGSLALTLVLWWGLRAKEEVTLRHLVLRQATSIGEEIQDEIQQEARALASMGQHWEQLDMSTPARQADAAEYLRSWSALDEIEWANADGEIRWVLPTERAARLIGQSLNAREDFVASRARALKEDAVVAGSVFTLADGRSGYSLLMPLTTEGHSGGFLRTQWRAADVLQPIVRRHLEMGYTVWITDHGRLVYDSGEQPDPQSPVIAQFVSTRGLHWTLRAAAASRALGEERSQMPMATLLSGVLLSMFMSGALHLWLIARQRREEVLHAEKRFQLLVEGVKDYAIYMLNPLGHVVTWNAGAERIQGWSARDIVGQHFSRFFTAEDIQQGCPQRLLATASAAGQVGEESWRRRRDCSRFWAGVLTTALYDAEGHLIGYSEVTRDLTERRGYESALQATLAFQSAILNNAHLAIIATDSDGIIRAFNPAAERMSGYRAHEVVGSKSPVFLHDDREVSHRAGELSQELGLRVDPGFEVLVAKPRTGVAEEREWTYVRKDGSRLPVILSVTALRGSDGTITGFMGIASDITERKRDENRIRNALREKEVLLKEVYHRVKNNLQVIQSLFYLQRRTLPEGFARNVIDDAGQRVRAMALVHEKLYQSRNLAQVSLPEYVRDLCAQLTAALRVGAPSVAIAIQVDAIEVGLAVAITLGLLLTELVSNSLKHAFPDQRAGEIQVRVIRQGIGVVISVFDNGIGFPAGFDPLATSSLGLKLASSLAQQLGGTLQIGCEGGAQFRVDVPAL
jgi:PAS domain S-box-containing protein